MAATQLNFALRTSVNCTTVHLLGSWDNYTGQLPLSKDSAKVGSWKGVFRFQAATLRQGQRYWYYYIIDGYHVSHDPAKEYTVEPTTGRRLNILDVPVVKASSTATTSSSSKRHSRRVSADIVKGRPLSPSKIVSPKPVKPNQTRKITTGDYEQARPPISVAQLSSRFSAATMSEASTEFASDTDSDSADDSDDSDDSDISDSGSGVSSDLPSLTSSRSASSRASSVSSASSCCTCERYGITRAGSRVKLDCGGARCAGSDMSDSCSSESDSEPDKARIARRNGLVIRS